MINYITYAGTSLRNFNLYVSGDGTYNAPEKDYSLTEIPGKSGDFAYDNKRFKNIDVTYKASFIYPNYESNIVDLKAFIYSKRGYQRLEDTYHPNEYRMALYKDGLDITVDMLNMFGVFDLVFHCKPQRYLKSGETSVTLTSNGSITNPTLFNSQPLLRVYGAGVLGIGTQSIVITEADEYTDIDCELMDAYKGTVSKNDKVSFSNYTFPVLVPGANAFDLGTGITSVVITPRWWTI